MKSLCVFSKCAIIAVKKLKYFKQEICRVDKVFYWFAKRLGFSRALTTPVLNTCPDMKGVTTDSV